MNLPKYLPDFKGFTPIKIKRFIISLGAAILLKSFIGCSHKPKSAIISDTEKVTVTGGRQVPMQLLSAEERKKPYARYFDMPMAKPKQALIDSVSNGPIDPSLALKADHLNDLLKPGYLPSEIGYCKFADGTGYVSSIVEMPGVTPEMFDWWFTWHQLDPLRYKIWDHYVHYDVQVNAIDRKKLLSETIPVHEKNWKVTHHVNEDIGFGASDIEIGFVSPKEFGFDMSRFKEPYVGTAICSNTGTRMCHFVRRINGGSELRTRFWFPAGMHVPIDALKGLNYHALEEFTTLAKILPSLYAAYGPKSRFDKSAGVVKSKPNRLGK